MMSSKINIESSGRFGTALHKALVESDVSLVEFCRTTDTSYEFLRKILKGQVFPSSSTLDDIVRPLGLNKREMEVLIAEDRMEKKVGKPVYAAALKRHPRSGEFDALLPHLSDPQIEQLLALMRVMMGQ